MLVIIINVVVAAVIDEIIAVGIVVIVFIIFLVFMEMIGDDVDGNGTQHHDDQHEYKFKNHLD